MNPAFIILLVLAVVVVWFSCSFLYKPIGKFFHKIYSDAKETILEEDKKDEEIKGEKH